ncbi:MAG: hypothetical protein WBG41_06580 [Acidimicrobiales bacterium]|jgi:hypothetical protein
MAKGGGSRKRSTNSHSEPRAPRERSEHRRPKSGATVDREALELRERGASYSAIARSLELRRAVDAHRAFIRALQGMSGEERVRLTGNEERRLDELETRIRERDAGKPEKIARRIEAVGQLRAALQPAAGADLP